MLNTPSNIQKMTCNNLMLKLISIFYGFNFKLAIVIFWNLWKHFPPQKIELPFSILKCECYTNISINLEKKISLISRKNKLTILK